jgi:hypothetical protein
VALTAIKNESKHLLHKTHKTHETHEMGDKVKFAYIFDNLPLEVIRYNIIPFLDYTGRTSLNLSLPPQDRQGYPLQKIPQLILSRHMVKSKYRIKFAKNLDPLWSSIATPHIVEHPRAMKQYELLTPSYADMLIQEHIMEIQLRNGQRIIHKGIRNGLYNREGHGDLPMKCRCCRSV